MMADSFCASSGLALAAGGWGFLLSTSGGLARDPCVAAGGARG